MIRSALAALIVSLSLPAAAAEIAVAAPPELDATGLARALPAEVQSATGVAIRVASAAPDTGLERLRSGDIDATIIDRRALDGAADVAGHVYDFAFNDYVLVGPGDDPAGVRGMHGIAQALARIAEARVPFVSRGDGGWLHARELELWRKTEVVVEDAGPWWYRPVDQDMAGALRAAASMQAYTLTDRATWIDGGQRLGLSLLLEGDPALANRHAFIAATEDARRVGAWLASEAGRDTIHELRFGPPAWLSGASD